MRLRAARILATAITLMSVVAAWPQNRAAAALPYTIDFHIIGTGGSTLRNSCFSLIGTIGQAAPGYSSTTSGAPVYSVYAGFWSAAVGAARDGIFFSGFEDC